MTNEQREAIDNLSEIVKLSKEELQKENENITAILDYKDLKSLDTILSLIKEKDKIINEQLKENVKLQKELNEENKRCMILANNDKFKEQVIDLIGEKLAKAYHYKMNECSLKKKELNNIDCNKYKDCTSCIKQYFEDKVNSSEQN